MRLHKRLSIASRRQLNKSIWSSYGTVGRLIRRYVSNVVASWDYDIHLVRFNGGKSVSEAVHRPLRFIRAESYYWGIINDYLARCTVNARPETLGSLFLWLIK